MDYILWREVWLLIAFPGLPWSLHSSIQPLKAKQNKNEKQNQKNLQVQINKFDQLYCT